MIEPGASRFLVAPEGLPISGAQFECCATAFLGKAVDAESADDSEIIAMYDWMIKKIKLAVDEAARLQLAEAAFDPAVLEPSGLLARAAQLQKSLDNFMTVSCIDFIVLMSTGSPYAAKKFVAFEKNGHYRAIMWQPQAMACLRTCRRSTAARSRRAGCASSSSTAR